MSDILYPSSDWSYDPHTIVEEEHEFIHFVPKPFLASTIDNLQTEVS